MSDQGGRRRSNLGRGLDALLGDDEGGYSNLDRLRQSRPVPIDRLQPNPYQPRRYFPEEELQTLIRSVREKGILQPILVRPAQGGGDSYEIVAGERRWRAAQRCQLHEVPVIIRDFSDSESLEIAIVENVQRHDLNPLEEAAGYRRLLQEFGRTQDDVAKVVGKSRSHVANTLRLLDLPDALQQMVVEGALSAGHARALLAAPDPAAAAAQVVERSLNVRQTEALVRSLTDRPDPPSAQSGRRKSGGAGGNVGAKDADTLALERDLTDRLGLTVDVRADGSGGGSVTIRFQTLEQLDGLVATLSRG